MAATAPAPTTLPPGALRRTGSVARIVSGSLSAASAIHNFCSRAHRGGAGGAGVGGVSPSAVSTRASDSSPGGFTSVPSTPSSAGAADETRAMATLLPQSAPDERIEELVQTGQTRREAVRQVTRENMGAEVREGMADTLQQGQLPGCVRFCSVLCSVLIVALLVAAVLLCAAVCAGCGLLHLSGWLLTWWLVGCDHQGELRMWLLVYQVSSLVELFACNLFRGCAQKVAAALDTRLRPGFARVIALSYTVVSFGLKIWWCVYVQVLVAKSAREFAQDPKEMEECGHWLPRFMGWYSCVLLLQLLIVEPALCAGMGLALALATRGLLSTSRGAKPGTLEAMEAVDFDEQMFAVADDPSDDRPQRECCFCLEEYDDSLAIVKTPCKHMMHKDCLAKWLQTSHCCPICRGNLEEGEDDEEEGGEAQGMAHPDLDV
mmetsp:Transcript_78733/g.228563  ORF Transcript_78733/g.228563 Transcript_78733/m.228563 type:complete len:433 (+) Transcript_78733:74-1372(+)